jgi:DNA invertase Pin-like site-specific DNA recombinase
LIALHALDWTSRDAIGKISQITQIDLLDFLRDLHAKRVDLFLHQQGLDTSTPSGKAMFQMMGVFAEFERAMIRERVLAGIARARDDGTRLGRPPLEDTDANKVKAVHAMRASGMGVRRIAREAGLGVGTVLRLVNTESSARIHETTVA